LLFLQEQPGDQEAAEDEKTQNAERARENRQCSFTPQVIENDEKNSYGSNSVQGWDGGQKER